MSNPQPEPSMEEILASIRRIISEDGEEEDASAAPAPRAKTGPRSAPQPAPRAETRAPAPEPHEEDRAQSRLETEDVEMIKKNVAEVMRDDEEVMLEETTAAAASKAFQDLSQSVRVSRGEGRTLEDIVTDLLKPLVKDWLDANLPGIVEEKVEEEVQRVARRRR